VRPDYFRSDKEFDWFDSAFRIGLIPKEILSLPQLTVLAGLTDKKSELANSHG
jgi:hypothetical protein